MAGFRSYIDVIKLKNMPTGIQTYNLELHKVEPIDWLSLLNDDIDIDVDDIDDDIELRQNKEKYKYTVGYNGYNIEVDRNEYDWNGKHYIQSMVEITRDELTLRDMYRFEPDEYHPDGLITTELPLEVTSRVDPISAEEKLIVKAKAIIDLLDENGSAKITMCNKGNILLDEAE